jgi:hypothetical protein
MYCTNYCMHDIFLDLFGISKLCICFASIHCEYIQIQNKITNLIYNCKLGRVPCASNVVIFEYVAIVTKKITPATQRTSLFTRYV